jgi:hypothetical protein
LKATQGNNNSSSASRQLSSYAKEHHIQFGSRHALCQFNALRPNWLVKPTPTAALWVPSASLRRGLPRALGLLMDYKNAKRVLWALAITVPFTPLYFLFTVNDDDQVVIQSQTSQLAGFLSFHYGGRGSSPRITLHTAERDFDFLCTRNIVSFPCSEAKQAIRLIQGKQGTVTFLKYERATPGMGYGKLKKLTIGPTTYVFED